ncbi:SDR family oxidoreductase [Maritalea porphyrae]|uniref:SDR family oxidoreductase n=1 Tax=Maritalea porphyrae TaxID=880732 RepID=UPI0022B02ADE|nr:NmrA family NAD(P)-binding protein [Maritalea porphyrae]MCZ4272621.1 NmrA family NAD(P)-binding protein [Maritalea porphyrae]
MTYKVAVFNANSSQAGPVVTQALDRGYSVRAIVRKLPPKDESVSNQNLEHCNADLLNKQQVVDALTGVDAAFLHFPVPMDFSHPEIWLSNFIEAAHKTKLPLLVFSTSGPAGDSFAPTPMIDGNTAIMSTLQASGLNVVYLLPTVYLENLFVPPFVPRLHSEGVLNYPPIPADQKIALVSHLDQATIAAAALERPDLAGQVFKIASPNPMTGPELAKELEQWVGRKVEFAPQNPDEFGAYIGKVLGSEVAGQGLGGLYKSIIAGGDAVASIDIESLERTLGVKLTSIADHIASWPKP